MGKRNLLFMGIGLVLGALAMILFYRWDSIHSVPAKADAVKAPLRGQNDEPRRETKTYSEEKVVKLSEAEAREFGIEVRRAGPGKLVERLSLPGEITFNPDRVTHVVPRVPGVIRSVYKSAGDSVRTGELMAVVESRELADGKAAYLAAMKRVELAEAALKREEMLWRKRISPEQDYLEARNALAEARITLTSAEQKLHAIGFSEEYLARLPAQKDVEYTRYEIRAPLDGLVIERHLTPGEFHKEDSSAFTIADLQTVWVKVSIYQKDLPLVRKGQRVLISAGRGVPDTEGRIAYLEQAIKEQTRTAVAVIILPNPAGLFRPGLFVTCSLEVGVTSVPVLVPKTAPVEGEDRTLIFLATNEGYEPRAVTLGRSDEVNTEVVYGIKPGERYVARGGFVLQAQLSKRSFGDEHGH